MRRLHWYGDLQPGDLQAEGLQSEGLASEPIEPLDDELILQLEQTFGVTLPDHYKEMLKTRHGDEPLECEILDPQTQRPRMGGMGRVLTAEPEDSYSIHNAVKYVADGVLPFAEDGGGNFTCFDYRQDRNTTSPPVVFWFHEQDEESNCHQLASSFEEFILKLQIPQDVIDDLRDQDLLPQDLLSQT